VIGTGYVKSCKESKGRRENIRELEMRQNRRDGRVEGFT
jgi:hypothetical protein